MVEFFRHSLGLCGEPHLNIWHLIFGSTGLASAFAFIRYKIFKNK